MNTGDISLFITIAFVYNYLISTIISKILGYDEIEKMCKDRYGVFFMDRSNYKTEDEYNAYKIQQDKCDVMRKDYDEKYFMYMLGVSIFTLLSGIYILSYSDDKYALVGAGLAFGGMLGSLYVLISNWEKITTNQRILFLSAALISLIYGSVYLYK